ncbi:insulinase family protein [bacterium]|nr:insulinase family protein [bacterium]
MREFKLKNNIHACVKVNKNTPRVALTLNLSLTEPEKYAGQYLLINRLLLKGTKTYNAVELASILEENAISLYTEMKYDFLRFRFVALNEDFNLALNILSDIILNSTFEDFEREKVKLKGEMLAELDSAKVKVSDLFTKTIYKNHFYGNSYTKILEEIDNATFDDIKAQYKNILLDSFKTLVLVGDIDTSNIEEILNSHFSELPLCVEKTSNISIPSIDKQELVEIIKEDAQQAQIIQGWLVPTIGEDDCVVIMLLNVLLGACGLSSRLFRELREKKGLAYTVRSSYELKKKSAIFDIYIGTAPTNIKTSLEGFNEEINKIKTELISDEELNNAKNNLIGKQQIITETNSQQANLMSYYSVMGFSYNYNNELIEKIKNVTAEDIRICANKIFSENYIVSIIRP